MASVKIPLLVGTSGGVPVSASPQRIWNLYPTISPASKENVVWKNTPGWDEWASVSGGTGRAMIVHKNNLYFVAGTTVYRATAANNVEVLGKITSTTTKVTMATDGFNLLIADVTSLYYFDTSVVIVGPNPGAIKTISIPFNNPSSIIFHDGHFVAREGGSGKFWISDKYDGLTWNALQFATAEDKPDDLVDIASDKFLWLFGEYTTQAYYNDGSSFPFKPNQQSNMRYGIIGKTAVVADNSIMWLARTSQGHMRVIKAQGFQPVPVSTPELEAEWSEYATVDDAYALSIQWHGKEWYVLTFPAEDKTYVYDPFGVWFEWGDYNNDTDKLKSVDFVAYAFWRNQNLCLSSSGKIYQLKDDVYNHDGSVMVSQFISNVQHTDEQRLIFHDLIYDMRTGVGPTNTESVINTSLSYDGGYTYDNWMERSLGIEGKYSKRIQWHKLGSGYNITIRSRITDEVPRQFLKAVANIDVFVPYLDRRNSRAGLPGEE
jgi:hypothetical protein